VIDVIEILTGSSIAKRYWSDLKKKPINEGSEAYEKIVRLKFEAADGKLRMTDVPKTFEGYIPILLLFPKTKISP
jgi:hypothetical protein